MKPVNLDLGASSGVSFFAGEKKLTGDRKLILN
jgi:hypothetical protein